eukprot:UN11582
MFIHISAGIPVKRKKTMNFYCNSGNSLLCMATLDKVCFVFKGGHVWTFCFYFVFTKSTLSKILKKRTSCECISKRFLQKKSSTFGKTKQCICIFAISKNYFTRKEFEGSPLTLPYNPE